MNIPNFIQELKRRNVFKVATAYAIAGWLIIQVFDTIVPQLNFPEWIAPFVTILVLGGFPLAIVFAWAFELTPDGIQKSKDVDITESVTSRTSKKLNGLIIGILSVLIVFLLFERFIIAPDSFAEDFADSITQSSTISQASVAVLPFVDLSQNGDQGYFSDGISEEILNVLVKVNDLKVASRTSSFQFKGRELGIPEIANELKVMHILEGSVRKSGDQIRITAQLIEAKTDKHLWSETYDRPLNTDNIFDIQDEISKAIVSEMGRLIGGVDIEVPEVIKSTANLGAYELYLKSRSAYLDRLRLDEADEQLTRAIELDPKYADAWELKAAINGLLNSYGYYEIDKLELEERGLEYANKTLELNPNSSLATATIGLIYKDRVERFEEGYSILDVIEQYDKALELDSLNATAILWKGINLLVLGYTDVAEQHFKRCLELEPRYAPCFENYILTLSINKSDEKAFKVHLEGLNSGMVKLKFSNFSMFARLGEELAFKSATNSESVLLGWNRHDELWQAHSNLEENNTKLARDIINYAKGKSVVDIGSVSILTYPLGVYETPIFSFMLWEPALTEFRRSDKFKEFIFKTGIFEYWKDNKLPSQCTLIGTNDFSCT